MAPDVATPLSLRQKISDPPEFKGAAAEAWARHAQGYVAEWLGQDFSWGHKPLLGSLVSLRVLAPDVELTLVAPTGSYRLEAEVATPDGMANAMAMTEDPCDDGWVEVIDRWKLEGRWLHPGVSWEMTAYGVATGTSMLPVGCVDRSDPSRPKRFDPSKDFWKNNLGVVKFPLYGYLRLPDWTSYGWAPELQSELMANTAVLEGCLHESLETYQEVLGQPVWDPHRDISLLGVAVWKIGGRFYRTTCDPGVFWEDVFPV